MQVCSDLECPILILEYSFWLCQNCTITAMLDTFFFGKGPCDRVYNQWSVQLLPLKNKYTIYVVSWHIDAQFRTARIPQSVPKVIFKTDVTQCELCPRITLTATFILIWLEMLWAFMRENTVVKPPITMLMLRHPLKSSYRLEEPVWGVLNVVSFSRWPEYIGISEEKNWHASWTRVVYHLYLFIYKLQVDSSKLVELWSENRIWPLWPLWPWKSRSWLQDK